MQPTARGDGTIREQRHQSTWSGRGDTNGLISATERIEFNIPQARTSAFVLPDRTLELLRRKIGGEKDWLR
jgi:hypothetical protein